MLTVYLTVRVGRLKRFDQGLRYEDLLVNDRLVTFEPHRPPPPHRGSEEAGAVSTVKQASSSFYPLAFVVFATPDAQGARKISLKSPIVVRPLSTIASGCSSSASSGESDR